MATKTINHLLEPRVVEFVTAARVARMATVDQSSTPHAIPICYWFDGGNFYFVIDEKPKRATGAGLKRMRNIASNPRVALIIDLYEEDWSELAYVLVHAVARVVEDSEEYLLALRHLRDKYRQYRAMELYPDRNPVVRIEPERVHVWGARFGAPSADTAHAR
jgi:PPOX class probable F420-dependent enzyme